MNLALVIGCAQYEDPELASLSFADADAALFASIVQTQCGLESDEIALLTSTSVDPLRKSTRSNIIRQIAYARDSASLGTLDKLFFFFSGHGFHSTESGIDYLIPQDAAVRGLEETSVSLHALSTYLGAGKAKATFVFLDVCRATVLAGKSIGELRPVDVSALSYRGTAIFWSCSPDEKSFEAERLGNGVFTSSLADALGDTGKCVTVYELDRYLTAVVPAVSRDQRLPIQRPYSRIEPVALKDAVIVSPARYREVQASVTAGDELRMPIAKSAAIFPTKIYCGLDFGTSYSAIAACDATGKVHFVPSDDGRVLMPSVVSVLPNFDYVTGWRAIERGAFHPDSTFSNLKRSLGSEQSFSVAGKKVTPEFLASLIIRSLKASAEEFFGAAIHGALVSAPANFTLQQCNSLMEACRLASLPVFRLVGEPSAAGLVAFREYIPLFNDQDSFVYIIDLGGGTFDVSVVQTGDGVWEIKAAGGDRALGGADYDEAVFKYIRSIVEREFRQTEESSRYEFSSRDLFQMKREAERVKIALTTREETVALVEGLEIPGKGFKTVEIPISRSLFRALTDELNRRIESCILDALNRSHVRKQAIDLIVSAGQGAKIFTVTELLDRLFADIPREVTFQENAVVLGLGRYTGVIAGCTSDTLLLDTLPTTVAVLCSKISDETAMTDRTAFFISRDAHKNKLAFALVPRDSTIPTRRLYSGNAIGGLGTALTVTLVEVDMSGEIIPIGYFETQLNDEPFEILCEVDANRSILVRILRGSDTLETYQVTDSESSTQKSAPRLLIAPILSLPSG